MAKAPAAKLGAGATASTIRTATARPRAVLNESTIPLPNCRSAPNLRQRSFQLGECAVEMRRDIRRTIASGRPGEGRDPYRGIYQWMHAARRPSQQPGPVVMGPGL